jgi:hypothetical protein
MRSRSITRRLADFEERFFFSLIIFYAGVAIAFLVTHI